MKTRTIISTLAVLFSIQFLFAQEFPKGVPLKIDKSHRSVLNYSDWQVVNHTGSQRDFTAIQFIDDYHGWIVGEFGTLIYTSDAGLSWEEYYFGPSIELKDLCFIDEHTGFVAGTVSIGANTKGIVFKTIDGGWHWELSYRSESSMMINAISFEDLQNGILSGHTLSPEGSSGLILRTTDAGDHWEAVSLNYIYSEIDNIVFSSTPENPRTKEGWATGKMLIGPSEVSVILRSTNGGYSWNTVLNNGSETQLLDIDFCNTQCGIAVGDNGSILLTDNSGKRWISSNIRRFKFNASLAGMYNKATVVGDQGLIFSTFDNGRNWTHEYTLSDVNLNDICATPNGLLWVVGDEGTLYVKHPEIIHDDEQEVPQSENSHYKDGISDEVFNHNTEKIAEPLLRHKIFPNPSSGHTTIGFELDRESQIKLDIYSINGQLIRTLLDQFLSHGEHAATFDANEFTPGIYTYTLKAGSQVKNGKIIIN